MGDAATSLFWRTYSCLPIALVGLLTLAWALRPGVPVLVRGMGVLASPDARRGFYARGAGEVQALLVRPGESVRPGQRLVSLDRVGQSAAGPTDSPSTATSPQTTEARLRALDAQSRVLAVQSRALDDQRAALLSRRRQIETSNRPVQSQLSALEALRSEEVIARYSPLWVGAQDLWLRNRADIASIEAALADLRAKRASLTAQASELSAQRASLRSDQLSQIVFSPISGRVLELSVQPGQPVTPGQRLGSLATSDVPTPPQAVVLFTTADASRLAAGGEIHLNPQLLSRDSFGGSEQRYGLIPATILRLSSESVDVADVANAVGSQEDALNLMASARQRSYGDGGDLTSQLPGRSGAPLVLAVVQLRQAPTPSGLAWTRSGGPARPLPQGTPAEASAEIEQRSVISYLLPFWRWLSGARG